MQPITLNARVTRLSSGVEEGDKKPRCMLSVDDADYGYNKLSLVNDRGLVLDQRLTITISAEPVDAETFDERNNYPHA